MVIKQKMTILAIVPISVLAVIVGISWNTMSGTGKTFEHTVNEEFVGLLDTDIEPLIKENMLPLINDDLQSMQALQDSIVLMLEADRDLHQAVIAEKMSLVANGDDEYQAADTFNDENLGQAASRMKKASATFTDQASKDLYATFEADFVKLKEESRTVIAWAGSDATREKAQESTNGGAAQKAFDEARDKIDKLQQVTQSKIDAVIAKIEDKKTFINEKEKVVLDKKQEVVADADKAVAGIRRAIVLFLTFGVVCSAAVFVLTLLTSRSILKPLHRIIVQLSGGAEQINSAADQVSGASQSLAEGATEQAAGLEETSSSLEEMSSMTKQNAENAGQANILATEASKSAQEGVNSMERMTSAIDDIQKSSDQTAKIIKVIDEIAFQTNLLALNAAVEAARAGEAGKGFAVVAEEVRNLAMRSAEAAKDTSNLIEESVKNARNGVEISNEVGKVLGEIVTSVSKTTELVGEIAAASTEQAQGIDQINTAVAQMDKVTQQNAANAEESASASEELNVQSRYLKQVVEDLVGMVGKFKNDPNANTNRSYGASDHLYHQIASGGSEKKKAAKSESTVSVAEAIPFDDDFSDF